MRIYLSPSIQQFNFDVDGVSEATTMNYIADALEPYLKTNAIGFTRNRLTQTLAQIIAESNAGNYDLHLAIHSNASPAATAGQARGSRMYHYATSANGRRFAEILANNMKTIYPDTSKVTVFPDTTLAELRLTNAPAVIVETAFHDNYEDSAWIKNNIQNIARVLAQSVAEYGGMQLIPVCISGTTPASQFMYTGLTYGHVCNVSSMLNMRSQPTSNSQVVMQLRNGTPVVVLGGNEGGWVLVRFNNTQGYVSANFLCVCNIPEVDANSRLGTVMTQGGRLNIRQSPSTSAPVLTTAPLGAQLIVLGETGSFYRVNYQGVTGFAWKSFIEV